MKRYINFMKCLVFFRTQLKSAIMYIYIFLFIVYIIAEKDYDESKSVTFQMHR